MKAQQQPNDKHMISSVVKLWNALNWITESQMHATYYFVAVVDDYNNLLLASWRQQKQTDLI